MVYFNFAENEANTHLLLLHIACSMCVNNFSYCWSSSRLSSCYKLLVLTCQYHLSAMRPGTFQGRQHAHRFLILHGVSAIELLALPLLLKVTFFTDHFSHQVQVIIKKCYYFCGKSSALARL